MNWTEVTITRNKTASGHTQMECQTCKNTWAVTRDFQQCGKNDVIEKNVINIDVIIQRACSNQLFIDVISCIIINPLRFHI